MCIYRVDIDGLLSIIFRRVHNKFHLGLFSIVYLVPSFRAAPGTSILKGFIKSISLLIEVQITRKRQERRHRRSGRRQSTD